MRDVGKFKRAAVPTSCRRNVHMQPELQRQDIGHLHSLRLYVRTGLSVTEASDCAAIVASPVDSTCTALMASDSTPLLPSSRFNPPARPARSVTFNPLVETSSPPKRTSGANPNPNPSSSATGLPPRDGALQKLKRRYSSGSPLINLPAQTSKLGPQRTTRTAQKLKLLPVRIVEHESLLCLRQANSYTRCGVRIRNKKTN